MTVAFKARATLHIWWRCGGAETVGPVNAEPLRLATPRRFRDITRTQSRLSVAISSQAIVQQFSFLFPTTHVPASQTWLSRISVPGAVPENVTNNGAQKSKTEIMKNGHS